MKQIIDTNVILRYLVGDNKEQLKQAQDFFKEAEDGKRTIVVKPIVVAEVCFVLESFYKKNREEISTAMEIFLSQRWLDVEDRLPLLSLWAWYKHNLHFVDSYLIALSRLDKLNILTFDKQLLKKTEANN